MTTEDELAKLNIGDRITLIVREHGKPDVPVLMEVTSHEDGGTQLRQVKEL